MRRRFFYSRLGIPSNEIWYTATAKITLNVEDGFGTTLISNKYYSGSMKGVLTFGGRISLIPDLAFFNQYNLTGIILPDSVTMIGIKAFMGCHNLKSITIPEGVTSIRGSVFEGCYSLTSITIPDGVTAIEDYAFSMCSSLTSITIPDGVTSIGDSAFRGCSSLTSITIPDGVTAIGGYAFRDCSSLTSITIPDSVIEIGEWAFYYCTNLTSIYCKATTPPTLIGTYVFAVNGSGRKIYVPYQSLDAYKTAPRWSEYAADIVGYDFENDTIV